MRLLATLLPCLLASVVSDDVCQSREDNTSGSCGSAPSDPASAYHAHGSAKEDLEGRGAAGVGVRAGSGTAGEEAWVEPGLGTGVGGGVKVLGGVASFGEGRVPAERDYGECGRMSRAQIETSLGDIWALFEGHGKGMYG